MKRASEVLEAAAGMLSAPGAWTQDWFAKDAAGERTDFDSVDASCWCAIGALERARMDGDPTPPLSYLQAIVGYDIAEWNDEPSRTQAEVVAALRNAAARARADESAAG